MASRIAMASPEAALRAVSTLFAPIGWSSRRGDFFRSTAGQRIEVIAGQAQLLVRGFGGVDVRHTAHSFGSDIPAG